MRRIYRRSERLSILIPIIALILLPFTTGDAHASLTATQSLMVEYDVTVGQWLALGTLVIDLAMGERHSLTYIHDRGWNEGGRHQGHDVSVTRVLWRDTTATMGVRLKLPEDGPGERFYYGLVAWRWGG